MNNSDSRSDVIFSIIILTYKSFDNLENNISSIASQKYGSFELIIQDDGSDNFDNIRIQEILKKYGLLEKASIYHNNINVGTVKNYNKAVKMANGKYIVPLSQDDCFFDDAVLGDLYTFFSSCSARVCYCKRQTKDGVTLPLKEDFDILKSGNIDYSYKRMLYRNFIFGATLYFEKQLWTEMGGFDEVNYRLLEDYPFALQLLDKNIMIYAFERISIIYGREGVSSIKGELTGTALVLNNDNIRLYKNFVKHKIDVFENSYCKRAYHFQWLSSFYGKNQSHKKKNKIIFKYIDCAIVRKVMFLLYKEKADNKYFNYLYNRIIK